MKHKTNYTKPITFGLATSYEDSNKCREAFNNAIDLFRRSYTSVDYGSYDAVKEIIYSTTVTDLFDTSLNKLAEYLRSLESVFYRKLAEKSSNSTVTTAYVLHDTPTRSKQRLVHVTMTKNASYLVLIRRNNSQLFLKGVILPKSNAFNAVNLSLDIVRLQRAIDPEHTYKHRFNIHTEWSLVKDMVNYAFDSQIGIPHLHDMWNTFYNMYNGGREWAVNNYARAKGNHKAMVELCTPILVRYTSSDDYDNRVDIFGSKAYKDLPGFFKETVRKDLHLAMHAILSYNDMKEQGA